MSSSTEEAVDHLEKAEGAAETLVAELSALVVERPDEWYEFNPETRAAMRRALALALKARDLLDGGV